MKPIVRKISLLLTVLMLLSSIFIPPAVSAAESTAQAADSGTDASSMKKQKIVSVLYDNSTSMYNNTENRAEYAKYALQFLMALLDENDTLYITPMNRATKDASGKIKLLKEDKKTAIKEGEEAEARYYSGTANTEYVEKVILSFDGSEAEKEQKRADEFKRILDLYFLKYTPISGNTPGSSIQTAIDIMVNEDGLKTDKETSQNTDDANKEYWLVVLSDGGFNGTTVTGNKEKTAQNVAKEINKYLNPTKNNVKASYTTLNTIYFGFGANSVDLNKSNTPVSNLTAYQSGEGSDIATKMQQIANQLSGRYQLDPDQGHYYLNPSNSNEIIVDLDQCGFSTKSITLIAQNCDFADAGISAKYNGKDVYKTRTWIIEGPNITENNNTKEERSSYSTILRNKGSTGSYTDFSGGKVTITIPNFPENSSIEDISIFVEPTLSLQSFIEYYDTKTNEWKETNVNYINSSLNQGAKVQVGFYIVDNSNKRIRYSDFTDMFGVVTSKATYNNATYDVVPDSEPVKITDASGKTVEEYQTARFVSKSINLVWGQKAITIELYAKKAVANGGKTYEYRLYDSFICNLQTEAERCSITSDPEVQGEIHYLDGKRTVAFTVKDKNEVLGSNKFAATQYSGGDNNTKTYQWKVTVTKGNQEIKVSPKMDSSGKITVEIVPSAGDGNYNVVCTVMRPGLKAGEYSAQSNVVLSYKAKNLEIDCDNSITLSAESTAQTFNIKVVDKANSDSPLTKAELNKGTLTIKLDNIEVAKDNYSVDNNGTIKLKLDPSTLSYGSKKLDISFTAAAIKPVTKTVTVTKNAGNYDFTCKTNPENIVFGMDTAVFEYEIKKKDAASRLTKKELERFTSMTFTVNDKIGNAVVGIKPEVSVSDNGLITVKIDAETLPYGEYSLVGSATEGGETYSSDPASFVKDKADFDYKIEIGEVGENGKVPASTTEVTYKVSVTVNGNPIDEATLAERFGIKLVISAPEGNPEEKTFAGDAIKDFIKNGLKQSVIKAGGYKLEAVLLENGTEVANDSMSFEKEEGDFTVEITGPDAVGSDAGDTEYTVVIKDKKKGNAQLTKAELEKRQIELTVTLDDQPDNVIVCKIEDDGTVKFTVDMKDRPYGQYKIQAAITESGAAQGGNTKDISKYPSKFTVTVDNENGLSMTEHQFKSNEQSLIFKLFAEDDIPYDFNDALIKFTLKLGGKVIDPELFKIEGNTLIYTPISEHNADITTGEYKISVDVVCNIKEEIKGERSVPLIIGDTKFVIVTLDSNKTVDRFDLKNLDAVIYFKVLRDGIPLSEEELRAALDSGTLAIDVSGVFGWMFWLPTGNEIAVETVDGVAVVSVRVTKDWIDPFWSFASMMILNGDKEIRATYPGAEACSDHITFTPSGVWSYIWRILVILFVIHCILYIIGFFNGKCQNLPWGSIVIANPSPTAGAAPCDFYSYPINDTWWKRNSWHIWRFFPHKKTLWYHQPGRYVAAARVTVLRDNNGNVMLSFRGEMNKFVYFNNGTQTASDFDAYKSALRVHKKNIKPKFDPSPQTINVRNMFQADAPIPAKRNVSSGGYYGTFYGVAHPQIDSIVFFVKHR